MQGASGKRAARTAVAWGACLSLIAGMLSGCGSSDGTSSSAETTSHRVANHAYAKATLQSPGEKASGTAVLAKQGTSHVLKVDVRGLDPTQGQSQYYLWQVETPKDRVALETPDNMVNLASYRVGGSGTLAVQLEPTPKASTALENGHLTHFLVTKVESPTKLENSILRFDRTGKPPVLGEPIAEGTFRGPLVGAGEPQ
jgi:hypothetical protein